MAHKNESAETTAPEMDAEARIYELGFHLDGDLPTEEAKKAYAQMRSTIASQGSIVAEGEPVKMQLAYTISRKEQNGRRDSNTAYFCWIAYEADTQMHAAVTEAAGAESRIVRFIDLVTTKEQALHAQELAQMYAKMEQERGQTEEEEVMDSEIDAALKEVEAAA